MRPQVVYILPRYDPATASHFFHLYEFLERARESLDIFLVVEQSISTTVHLDAAWYVQRFAFPPLRAAELFCILLWARLRGYRFFYTHYSFYGAFASWLITRCFGGVAYYWNCGMPWLYRRSQLSEALFRFILAHAILVTGTPRLARDYAEHYGLDQERVRVVPNWINLERFARVGADLTLKERLGIPPENKVVLFVHRLSRRKGAHLLPAIVREVAAVRNDVTFVIVGSGPEEESTKSEIRTSQLDERVRFVGAVPQHGVPAYFSIADVFIMPSEEEGFPHVLLEAMASGVPYVASDVGGVREITPSVLEEFVTPLSDVGGFAKRVIVLLEKEPPEVSTIAHAEQEWVGQYGIGAALPRFFSLFA